MSIYTLWEECSENPENKTALMAFKNAVDFEPSGKSYYKVRDSDDEEMSLCLFVQVESCDDYDGIHIYASDFFQENPNAYTVMEGHVVFYDLDKEKPCERTYKKFKKYLAMNNFTYKKENNT